MYIELARSFGNPTLIPLLVNAFGHLINTIVFLHNRASIKRKFAAFVIYDCWNSSQYIMRAICKKYHRIGIILHQSGVAVLLYIYVAS